MTFEQKIKFALWPKRTWIEWPECIKGKCGEWVSETIPNPPLPSKKEIIDKLEQLRDKEREYGNIIRTRSNPRNHWFWYMVVEELFLSERPELEKQLRRYKLLEYTKDTPGRISPLDIERAKQHPIGDFIQLNRAGYAKCPFHEEKTASFSVNKKKNLYYCFGCSEGGDSIKFIMKLNNLSFIDAVKLLCKM